MYPAKTVMMTMIMSRNCAVWLVMIAVVLTTVSDAGDQTCDRTERVPGVEQAVESSEYTSAERIDDGKLVIEVDRYFEARASKNLDSMLDHLAPPDGDDLSNWRRVYAGYLEKEMILEWRVYAAQRVTDQLGGFRVFTMVRTEVEGKCWEDVINERWIHDGGQWRLYPRLSRAV